MPERGVTADALVVDGLTVRLGRRTILDGVSFTVPAGGSLAVIGASGSGKTVLLRALIGAVPCEGSVRWARGTRIGYVPQKLDLERDLPLTGLDFLRAKAGVMRTAAGEAGRALRLTGLPAEVASQPIGTLSGGQFQRLLVAFALVGRPNVLLFDEPTAGIDEPGEENLYAMIARVRAEERLAVVLVSHELSVVYRMADRVLCLARGRARLGPTLEILTPEALRDVYGAPVAFHDHAGQR
jgi:zinc transport system ATP-binding protein